jgi:RHS repeat-associated protein
MLRARASARRWTSRTSACRQDQGTGGVEDPVPGGRRPARCGKRAVSVRQATTLGTVVNVVDVGDVLGDVVERYDYGDYGEVRFLDKDGDPLPVPTNFTYADTLVEARSLYTGRRPMPHGSTATSMVLVDYRHRVMEPYSGKFSQRDPIGYFGGINFFAYTNCSPMTYTDPDGLRPQDADPGGPYRDDEWIFIPSPKDDRPFIVTNIDCCFQIDNFIEDHYKDVGTDQVSDTYRHCMATCLIARQCGAPIAILCGAGKEVLDFAGRRDFRDCVDDMRGNKEGVGGSRWAGWLGLLGPYSPIRRLFVSVHVDFAHCDDECSRRDLPNTISQQ